MITVATVRPETMLADTAVAVHPDDERYARPRRQALRSLPLVGRRLPIIADDYVDPEFGTGALKITPGHDPNDFEIGRRHGLEEISVIGEDGRMTEEAGERFAGLTAAEAQEARRRGAARGGQHPQRGALHALGPVLAPLRRADRAADLAAVVLPHGRARRAGDRGRRARRGADRHAGAVEARLPRLDAKRSGPGASRASSGGATGCRSGTATRARRSSSPSPTPERCPTCDGALRQDEDVLDTWFCSALWPFATLGWPDDTAGAARLLPDRLPRRRRATSSTSGSRG